ncbi:MAG TPA: vWA domain-containing protein [Polyangiales bacterium]|nr:vWA domain-containing protein [Polyangiales bacterium]
MRIATTLRVSMCMLALGCGSSETKPKEEGRAQVDAGGSDGGASAARDARVATRDSSSGDGDSTGSRRDSGGGGGNSEECGTIELTTQRVVPRVWLLIDGSGSMSASLAGLAGPSRFAVLRQALLDPTDGLVTKLAGSVAFGLMIYDGGMSPPGVYVPGLCPRVIVVEPALDNTQAISAAYPAEPTGASTPTHYALLDLQDRITASMSTDPSFVLLATDGKPNLCDFHDGIPASAATEQEAVDTVAQLQQAGTQTFALSLAGGDAELQAHLSSLAEAGGTGSNVFSPSSQDALVTALTEIFGGTQSCTIEVEGKIVPGKECSGEVTLDDQKLACETDYRVGADKQSLELLGDACTKLRSQPTSKLSASFACDDVILL